ncbi:MAG: glycerophosphodiester phosphodiesterase family protein [Thiothrix sp.]|uniref:glycerophosphodiester phosphodiesterase n=1 Tax=Thiothrix sp. TaxID=1032 RepID=UPI00261F627B|nr:glycerophosphodiester phosphodiesterase family protein [Thiothrix sp.]MDD5394497.1 glycerophosphodiester phosphodiesterase family protein [Thiothrix sp.]
MADIHKGVTAHRGNSIEFPENTLSSIKSAIDLKVDWIEVDIHKTKDNQLVVIHDKSTGRVANLNLLVSKSTYQELMNLDMSYNFKKINNIPNIKLQKIPLLSEAFQLIKFHNQVKLSVQPKCNCVKEIINLAKEMDVIKNIGFNDISINKMALVKQIDSEIPVFWDRHPFTIISRDIKNAQQLEFEYIMIHKTRARPYLIDMAHKYGIKIGVWTVNEKIEMERFLLMGIDRIYTDNPRLLISISTKIAQD